MGGERSNEPAQFLRRLYTSGKMFIHFLTLSSIVLSRVSKSSPPEPLQGAISGTISAAVVYVGFPSSWSEIG